MKKLAVSLAAAMILSTLSFAASAHKERTFTGEIMDGACAKMGSHDMMMKKEGTKNAKDCSEECVKHGGKYVLFDSENKKVYQLDDQKKAKKFAGEKVTVKGSSKKAKNYIHVTDIQGS